MRELDYCAEHGEGAVYCEKCVAEQRARADAAEARNEAARRDCLAHHVPKELLAGAKVRIAVLEKRLAEAERLIRLLWLPAKRPGTPRSEYESMVNDIEAWLEGSVPR